METMGWLIIFIVLIVIELLTMGLTTIWFAGGALIAGIAAVAGAGRVVQFVFVSDCLTDPADFYKTDCHAIPEYQSNPVPMTESLIGKEAVVTQTIENLKNQGQVIVGGIEWTARTDDNEKMLEKDTVVEIERIEGVKLIVKKKG